MDVEKLYQTLNLADGYVLFQGGSAVLEASGKRGGILVLET